MRIAIALAVAFALAGCMGQQPVRVIGNDLPSACIQNKAEYDGYRDCCDIRRTCTQRKTADDLRSSAKATCANSDTAANISAVRVVTKQIEALECRR